MRSQYTKKSRKKEIRNRLRRCPHKKCRILQASLPVKSSAVSVCFDVLALLECACWNGIRSRYSPRALQEYLNPLPEQCTSDSMLAFCVVFAPFYLLLGLHANAQTCRLGNRSPTAVSSRSHEVLNGLFIND